MVSLADLDVPDDLACSRCGETIARGYLPAVERGEETALEPGAAVCDACGWAEVGATGFAPTLSDFDDGDALVRVERDDGLAPAAITDEA